ncbi:Uds1 domain containing protein [Pyrenophora teres f. teres]|uniref:Uds1 domain containing protein n=1 Tax=Pyrenophora teres f. teres TaxID=97479 RepID=A0A6S6VTM2_9PLEO|nr:Uds1 domain containing protein [Pyrenophora teres f. teres]
MTHIANCMRSDTDKSPIYISLETSSRIMVSRPARPLCPMNHHPPRRSCSLKDLQPSRNSNSPGTAPSAFTQPATSKYQLWPSAKSPVGLSKPSHSSDKLAALAVTRSSTSLSDTAVLPESSLPFWQRAGSLSRRRKVSVPELGNTMTTVQEMSIDSPTIPGRPPLRKQSYDAFGHERSTSAPGSNWRTGPFGDAMMVCVTGPSASSSHANNGPPSSDMISGTGRPLSPILSPGATPRPLLKLETGNIEEEPELPPQVPPKSPAVERKASPAPLVLHSRALKPQLTTPASTTPGAPFSASDLRRSPNGSVPLPTPPSAFTNPFYATSPASARNSPRTERKDPMATQSSSHNRNMSESSIMERGRPKRRNSKRERSRTVSEADGPEPTPDPWKLPQGMRVPEASRRMSDGDKKLLHKQAYDQAGNFEVLNKRDVASLSRELRALDERCDYLRKTYKSLRAGRQKLHGRMIAYLRRGETVIFSRESLLKQEEALAELDISIDEFILKLEQAENRRLRLRQKLLEHVAAAIVLDPRSRDHVAETTPPRSPVKLDSPARAERKETESIKIYADGHVLNLFSDIERAIGKMCEQTC